MDAAAAASLRLIPAVDAAATAAVLMVKVFLFEKWCEK